ncbi:hypothetical protein ACFFK0_13065 [Paenibacillus chartarius]|uniref:Uncharacterized protein n=1 Tax=Paenibacillus chartarius TaxID=747481 RepID=A0ABV6DL46_9BACL
MKIKKAFIIAVGIVVMSWFLLLVAYYVVPSVSGEMTASHFLDDLANKRFAAAAKRIDTANAEEWTKLMEELDTKGVALAGYSGLRVNIDDSALDGQATVDIQAGEAVQLENNALITASLAFHVIRRIDFMAYSRMSCVGSLYAYVR